MAVISVGLISDTHGLLRPEAVAFLRGSDLIIHCGDICEPGVIRQLYGIAPVNAVRGNNDTGPWADELPETEIIRIRQIFAYVIHDLAGIDIDPQASGVTVVLSGHSHKPSIVCRDGITYRKSGQCRPAPIQVADLGRGTDCRRWLSGSANRGVRRCRSCPR